MDRLHLLKETSLLQLGTSSHRYLSFRVSSALFLFDKGLHVQVVETSYISHAVSWVCQ